MTTSYCSKDEWADREKGLTWAAYVAVGYEDPTADDLEETLNMGTRIINKTIGFISSNITDSAYTVWLKDLNYQLANRIRAVKRNRGFEGAMFRFSPQDYLFINERKDLMDIGKIKKKRRVGRLVF